MMLKYLIAGFISFSQIRETFSRTLMPNVDIYPVSRYREADYRNHRNPENHVLPNVFSIIDNHDEFLDVRIQEYNMKRVDIIQIGTPLDSIRDEIEQSHLQLETKNIRRHRGKRHSQSYHPLCHFKVCGMGRIRHV